MHELDLQVPDKIWIESPLFPSYYKTFHFQTEGWLSTWSSRAYEYNTEVRERKLTAYCTAQRSISFLRSCYARSLRRASSLSLSLCITHTYPHVVRTYSANGSQSTRQVLFSGRQDAMQRQALLPLKEFMEGRNQASVRILEIGAGTGRYHTFLRDNYPAAKTTIVDLSPFYLERARDNIDYWVKSRCQGRERASRSLRSHLQLRSSHSSPYYHLCTSPTNLNRIRCDFIFVCFSCTSKCCFLYVSLQAPTWAAQPT